MKRLPIIIIAAIIAVAAISCKTGDDVDNWSKYREWRELNNAWLADTINYIDPKTGELYFTKIVPSWDAGAAVYMHWFNDRSLTADALSPLRTSTVDVKYRGTDFLRQPFDSSYLSTSPADSVLRFKVQNLVEGWNIALNQMHVGDSVEVIIPYTFGYGNIAQKNSKGEVAIKPYSHLVFNMKLVGVPSLYK